MNKIPFIAVNKCYKSDQKILYEIHELINTNSPDPMDERIQLHAQKYATSQYLPRLQILSMVLTIMIVHFNSYNLFK